MQAVIPEACGRMSPGTCSLSTMNINVNKNRPLSYTAASTRHVTTLDAQTSVARVNVKRTFDDYQEKQSNGKSPALADLTNRAEFRRPTTSPDSGPRVLKAGAIHDIFDNGPSEYSQRKALALTPSITANPLLDLSHAAYGLPPKLTDNLQSLGIKSIYPWQSECLLKSGTLEGEVNLVYTAPTGGGKSLVADILMLKKVVGSSAKKALLVLPYVALVQEKLRWLRKVTEGITRTKENPDDEQRPTAWRNRGDENAVRVGGFFGGSKVKSTWRDIDIAVCTIEKVFL